jgi:hypothetical protein
MNRINRIIKEEINKFILSEIVNGNPLANYASQINRSLDNFKNINTSGFNNDLKKFFDDFTVYCVQIIAAINRCVNANSLNEVNLGSLRDYGINLPGELGGNLWSDMVQGYHNTKRFLQRGRGYGNSPRGYASVSRITPNTVPTVKLSVLLQQLPQWQQTYNMKNSKYGIDNYTLEVGNLLRNIIPNLQTEYQNMINAQGTNP